MNNSTKISISILVVVIIMVSFVFYNLYLPNSSSDNRKNACVLIDISFGSSCYTNQSYACIYVNLTETGNPKFSLAVNPGSHCGLVLSYIGNTTEEASKNASFEPFRNSDPHNGYLGAFVINPNVSSFITSNISHLNAFVCLNITYNVSRQVIRWNFEDFSNVFYSNGNFSRAPNGFYVITLYKFSSLNCGISNPNVSKVIWSSQRPVTRLERP